MKNEHNKTSQFFRMRINREENKNKKELYIKQFDNYKKNYQSKKTLYENKKLKEQDFINWIIAQKEKHIKSKDNKINK